MDVAFFSLDIYKYAVYGASKFSICQHGLLLTVVKPTLQ